jgi:Holliday junction resolvase RusA-like endonuclease
VPVAQPRPRAVLRKGARHADMIGAVAHHPIHAFKATCAHAYRLAYPGIAPLEGALVVDIVAVMPRPKSKLWKSKPMPREWYAAERSDWDNIGKAVCDALNEIAWRDDGQVVVGRVARVIAAGDEAPHVEVSIWHAPPNPWPMTDDGKRGAA